MKTWEAWRTENQRLILAGWTLGVDFGLDGTLQYYATKDGVWIDNDPPEDKEEELPDSQLGDGT
jgi:hypothetical protein